MKAKADAKTLKGLHEQVFKTSPVGITLTRPIEVQTKLEVF